MGALYNDIEGYAVKLLNLRIKDGWLPQGDVSNEDIRTLSQKDLSKFNHIHLFAGIGGFPLAARMAGVPDDFRLFTAGFPCQPFSNAGARAGTTDNRYLWPETLSALRSHRPDVAILENVAGLVSMAFPNYETLMDVQTLTAGLRDYHYSEKALAVIERITVDVEEAGYTVQALIIPACAVDAKHRRDRIWFICLSNTYTDNMRSTKQERKYQGAKNNSGSCAHELGAFADVADSDRARKSQQTRGQCESGLGAIERGEDVANPKSRGRGELRHGHKTQGSDSGKKPQFIGGGSIRETNVPDSAGRGRKEPGQPIEPLHSAPRETWQTTQFINGGQRCEWSPEPAVGRVVNGLSGRVDRIKGLGNASVAQVAAEILRHILRALGVDPVFVYPFGEAQS